MRTREQEVEPLVNLADITEIELLILKRMREFTLGDHASLFHGTGFDFVGLRDWQAGDRFASIDWAQSSLTNFSPLIVREFEQPSTSRSHRRRRPLGVDAVRRGRRADRGGHRARDRHHRHVGRVLPGLVRPHHLRRADQRDRAPCGRASARAT